jgi:hypothetical protein
VGSPALHLPRSTCSAWPRAALHSGPCDRLMLRQSLFLLMHACRAFPSSERYGTPGRHCERHSHTRANTGCWTTPTPTPTAHGFPNRACSQLGRARRGVQVPDLRSGVCVCVCVCVCALLANECGREYSAVASSPSWVSSLSWTTTRMCIESCAHLITWEDSCPTCAGHCADGSTQFFAASHWTCMRRQHTQFTLTSFTCMMSWTASSHSFGHVALLRHPPAHLPQLV